MIFPFRLQLHDGTGIGYVQQLASSIQQEPLAGRDPAPAVDSAYE